MFRFQYGRIYYSSRGYIPQNVIMPNVPQEAWLMYPIYINQDDFHLVYMLSKKPGTFNGAFVTGDSIFPECGKEYLYPHSRNTHHYFDAQHYLRRDQIQRISGLNHANFLNGDHSSELKNIFEIGKIYQDNQGSGYRIKLISRTKHTATYQVCDGYKILHNPKKSRISTDAKTKREFILGYAGTLYYGHYWPDTTEYSSLDDCCKVEELNTQQRKLILATNPRFNYSLITPGDLN